MGSGKLTWVCRNEGAIEPEEWILRVDEDGFLFAVAGIEELEEWCEDLVAHIIKKKKKQEDGANGAKMGAGVLNFFDTTWIRVIDVPSIEVLGRGHGGTYAAWT